MIYSCARALTEEDVTTPDTQSSTIQQHWRIVNFLLVSHLQRPTVSDSSLSTASCSLISVSLPKCTCWKVRRSRGSEDGVQSNHARINSLLVTQRFMSRYADCPMSPVTDLMAPEKASISCSSNTPDLKPRSQATQLRITCQSEPP